MSQRERRVLQGRNPRARAAAMRQDSAGVAADVRADHGPEVVRAELDERSTAM